MKNIIAKLSIGLLAGSCLSGYAQAECTPSPDCGTLGYTKSDTECNGASFVRCPFDTSKVACLVSVTCEDGKFLSSEPADQKCTEINFGGNKCYKDCRAKTCEEKGQKTCNGVCIATTQCCTDADCGSNYICNASTRACELGVACGTSPYKVGDIYCNASGTPIGVVGKISNGGKNGIAVEKNHSSSAMQWGCYGTDLSCITNMPGSDGGSNPELRADYNGKANTACMVSNCGSGTAGYYCKNRSVEGVTGWYLPAGDELYDTMIGNRATVNSGLSKIPGATAIPSAGQSYFYWSSSESSDYSAYDAWLWTFYDDYWYYLSKNLSYTNPGDGFYVRCVLDF